MATDLQGVSSELEQLNSDLLRRLEKLKKEQAESYKNLASAMRTTRLPHRKKVEIERLFELVLAASCAVAYTTALISAISSMLSNVNSDSDAVGNLQKVSDENATGSK